MSWAVTKPMGENGGYALEYGRPGELSQLLYGMAADRAEELWKHLLEMERLAAAVPALLEAVDLAIGCVGDEAVLRPVRAAVAAARGTPPDDGYRRFLTFDGTTLTVKPADVLRITARTEDTCWVRLSGEDDSIVVNGSAREVRRWLGVR